MTQGVNEFTPDTPAPEAIPLLIAAKAEAEQARLGLLLAPAGFRVIACREISEALDVVQGMPDTLLLAESSALRSRMRESFQELQIRCPRVRRIVLIDHSDLPGVAAAINDGLVHRLLIRPLETDQIVDALREQASHQRLVERASELKALAAKKSRELDLAQRLLRLQRLAAVGSLAAGLAHEINNPLGSILAFAQILIREGRSTPEDLEALQYIEQGAVRCKRVIDALVRFAQMSNAPETYEPVRLAEVAHETVGLMRKEMEAAGARTQVQIVDEALSVRGAVQPLLQLTQALLANAVEATATGRGGQIDIQVFQRGDRACLSVRDNGRGVALDLQERIFEPFYTTKTEGEAIGLGLTTAERIAESHGGLIEVDSRPNEGSTFTLVLPRLDLGNREMRS